MSELVTQLRQDHEHISRLLEILSKQAEHLAAGEFTDYRIITDVMHYIVNYPNVYHHPGEDAVIAELKDRDISSSDLVDEILDEHRSMSLESNKILDEMIQIQGNAIFSRDDLVSRLKAFIRNYHAHIDKEEKSVFPRAEAALTVDDWKKIKDKLGAAGTREFDSVLDREYRDLYNFIMSEDKDT